MGLTISNKRFEAFWILLYLHDMEPSRFSYAFAWMTLLNVLLRLRTCLRNIEPHVKTRSFIDPVVEPPTCGERFPACVQVGRTRQMFQGE